MPICQFTARYDPRTRQWFPDHLPYHAECSLTFAQRHVCIATPAVR